MVEEFNSDSRAPESRSESTIMVEEFNSDSRAPESRSKSTIKERILRQIEDARTKYPSLDKELYKIYDEGEDQPFHDIHHLAVQRFKEELHKLAGLDLTLENQVNERQKIQKAMELTNLALAVDKRWSVQEYTEFLATIDKLNNQIVLSTTDAPNFREVHNSFAHLCIGAESDYSRGGLEIVETF